MIYLASLILVFLSATVEASFWSIPLTLLVVIGFGIFAKQYWVFLLAVFAGLIVDSLSFRTLGTSSIFFLAIVGALFLYGRKFETDHVIFGTGFTLAASALYILLFGSGEFSLALVSIGALSCFVFGFLFFLMQAKRDRMRL